MSEKLQFSVCPHDTAKHMVEWFHFNTYMQRRLGNGIHFEPEDNFNVEREKVLSNPFHIVYANPFSACAFIERKGFIPIARPVGCYDETIMVAAAGKGIPEHRPIKVASASDKLIVHILGLSLLEARGIHPADCSFSLVGNHMKAANAVLKEEADIGFVFNETWHGMSAKGREQFAVVAESTDAIAFHCFLIAPELEPRRDEIRDMLVGMSDDPKGQKIVASLDFEGIEALSEDAMDTLQTLLVYYNTLQERQ